MLRRTLAVVVALAGSATLAAPASGMSAPDTVAAPQATSSYGPGYSPAISQSDSVYPDHGDPRIDVLDYDLNLSWDAGSSTLQGMATLTLRAVQSADSFSLDLSHRLTATAVQVGVLNAGPLTGVPFQADGDRLTVNQAIQAGNTYRLTVTYAGKPGPVKAPTDRVDMPNVGWHTTSKGGAWTMQEPYGAFTWYPVNDMPADKAMYTLRVDVPDTMVGISNGTMTRSHVGNRVVTKFTNAHPMPSYLVTLAIGAYRKYTQTGPGGLPMTYWYPKGRSDLLTPMKQLPGVMTWLERKLGPYPFDRVGVVVTPGSSSAMETPTMITLGQQNYRYGDRDVVETLMHELTHAWYGDTVTPTDWSDLWMNEGMAMFLESQYSVAQGWKPWKYWRHLFYGNDPYWREIYGPPGAYNHARFAEVNVYYCTARMFDKLRRQVGNKTFYSLVKAWPQTHLDKSTDRSAYIGWVHRKTGQNLDAFFRTELDDMKPTL